VAGALQAEGAGGLARRRRIRYSQQGTRSEEQGARLIGEYRVVKKGGGGGSVNYPTLTKTNYNDWALLMKIKLQVRNLWCAVKSTGDVDMQLDRMALDAICSAIPPEMISTIAVKASAKEAWESIKVMRIRSLLLKLGQPIG
jgi:hypothetical protein